MSVDLSDWVGRTETEDDILAFPLVRGLRATLDHDDVEATGRSAPQASHFMDAPPIAPLRSLGPDGHPAKGGFLPPVPVLRPPRGRRRPHRRGNSRVRYVRDASGQ